jgi:hypothetical protein
MKLTKQNTEFTPLTIVIENQKDLGIFWAMVTQAQLTTEERSVHNMATQISDWLAKEKVYIKFKLRENITC